MPRPVLCILTLVILCFCLEGRTSCEPITEGRALSNGLIAFADAPDRRPGPQASQYAQIYTITPDGRNQKQLTTGKPGNFFPAWSSSGEQLAFVSTRNQKREIRRPVGKSKALLAPAPKTKTVSMSTIPNNNSIYDIRKKPFLVFRALVVAFIGWLMV